MPQPRELRPYQKEAVSAVIEYWQRPSEKERWTPCVVLPTGTGKSTVIAQLAVIAAGAGLRVLLLAHRRELLDQMLDSVEAVAPGRFSTGVVQGDRNEPDAQIVAGSFQTLASAPRLESVGKRDVVLVDEMHHSTAPTYLKVLDSLEVTQSGTSVVAAGFTATASRADGGLGAVWDAIVYEKSLVWAIRQGFLCKPRGLTVVIPGLDLSNVKVTRGDYAPGELEDVMASSVETTVQAMLTHAPNRRSIVFAAGVDHAESLAATLAAHGVPAAAVTGAMNSEAREEVYTAYRDGSLAVMVTVQVLTEGADFPMCDCVVMARPTRSQTLYSQMVGRAVRLYPGKEDALVLDLAGSVRDMSLVTIADLDAEAPTKRVSPASEEDPGQEELEVKEPVPRRERIGEAQLENIDLLAMSPLRWLSTPKGVRFLDCQDGTVIFLYPENPTEDAPVDVAVMHNPPQPSDGIVKANMHLSNAQDFAEGLAKRVGNPPVRNAPWRAAGKPPSNGQITMAEHLGIEGAANMTRARVSDEISVNLAAKRIDPYIT